MHMMMAHGPNQNAGNGSHTADEDESMASPEPTMNAMRGPTADKRKRARRPRRGRRPRK
jgi:hypothetical protein